MRFDIPPGEYLKRLEVSASGVDVEFAKKKKIALLFISLNDIYWPYLTQVIADCKKHLLTSHTVDYFVWTDYGSEGKRKQLANLEAIYVRFRGAPPEQKQAPLNELLNVFAATLRLYETFYPAQVLGAAEQLKKEGLMFKRDADKFWIESARPLTETDVALFYAIVKQLLLLAHKNMDAALEGAVITETEPIEWPAPTLMRYHLFLNQEEKLKEYDYVFYMDADMRVVAAVGDEILGPGLTAAEHPMYSLRKEYVPPYEPNPLSSAYIKRVGKVVTDETGKPRFKPYYYAGGFQGGVAKDFIEAMQVMKERIDKDFNNNYVAIWNDESHWNKYLSEVEPAIVLSPSYIYPDSLIDDYYVKVWGQKYEPKIITLTKPFSLTAKGAEEINKFIKQ